MWFKNQIAITETKNYYSCKGHISYLNLNMHTEADSATRRKIQVSASGFTMLEGNQEAANRPPSLLLPQGIQGKPYARIKVGV